MLQRQIMYKQLQELQRRQQQQIQEAGGSRNQDYVDQLTSFKQPSPVQISPIVNGAPLNDSRMLMFDNMQMMQQGESSIFQGFPSGLAFSQGQNNALGMSPPQFDMSLYGYDNLATNTDKSLNQHHYLQDSSNFSANQSSKNSNSPLGMSPAHPSSITRSYMSEQGNFSADGSTVSDGSLLSCQVFQGKNLFGQVPFDNCNSNLEDTGWPHNSPGEVSKVEISEASATLDPLEEKILYSSDDHGWLSSFGTSSKAGGGDFECTVENPTFTDAITSIQRGGWSALMQSAVTETSSSDTVVQEEWSGLSFQNPEPSSDKLQDSWDRNLQNVSSPSSVPEQLFPMNRSFPGFQQPGAQFLKQRDDFNCESSQVSGQMNVYNSQMKQPIGRNQLLETSLLSENNWTAQYKENFKNSHEFKDTLWRSNPMPGGFQTPYDQLNQANFHSYSGESEKMGDPLSAHLGASDPYGQNLSAQSILPNSQEFSFRPGPADSRAPQSYSLFPSMPMGNSNFKSLPNSYEKDYTKNWNPTPPAPNYMTTKFQPHSDPSSPQIDFQGNTSSSGPKFSLWENVASTQPLTSVSSQCVGFSTGLPPLGPDVASQQVVSSPRANKLSSNLFQTPGSASSSLETKPQSLELAGLTSKHEDNDSRLSLRKYYSEVDGVASGTYTRHTSPLSSDQLEQRDIATPIVSVSDSRSFSHPLPQNYSLHKQFHGSRDGQIVSGMRFPFNYEQATADAREPLLSGKSVAVKDRAKSSMEGVQLSAFSVGNDSGSLKNEAHDEPAAKAILTDYNHNDSQSHSIDRKEALNVAYKSQNSLQMAPSWLKKYGDSKNEQALSTNDPKAAAPSFSGLNIINLPENRLNMQVSSANTAQGSGTWPSSAAIQLASTHVSPPSMLSSDVAYQNLVVSQLKKRKIVAFDSGPWHRELNSDAPRPQNISTAEFEWAQALDRRQEEARNETNSVVDVLPVGRAKRRLILTTQLMQQVFRPPAAAALLRDASSDCDYVAYSAARTTLGDACNLSRKIPADSNVSLDKLNNSKRTSPRDFSKIVECLISRTEKLEGDLSRFDQSISIVDIKVENQELEKFSTLNRFAKFHFKAHSSTADPASSSAPAAMQKMTPQRYVTPAPMPRTLPEDRECLSL